MAPLCCGAKRALHMSTISILQCNIALRSPSLQLLLKYNSAVKAPGSFRQERTDLSAGLLSRDRRRAGVLRVATTYGHGSLEPVSGSAARGTVYQNARGAVRMNNREPKDVKETLV